MKNAFDAIDADANAVVTRAEAEVAIIRDHFDAIYRNGDGAVAPAGMEAQAQADVAASDRNGDEILN